MGLPLMGDVQGDDIYEIILNKRGNFVFYSFFLTYSLSISEAIISDSDML